MSLLSRKGLKLLKTLLLIGLVIADNEMQEKRCYRLATITGMRTAKSCAEC